MVQERLKKLNLDYDKASDVLYASFGPPREAICVDIGDGDLIRLDASSNEVVGVTVLDFKDKYMSTEDSSAQEAAQKIVPRLIEKYKLLRSKCSFPS